MLYLRFVGGFIPVYFVFLLFLSAFYLLRSEAVWGHEHPQHLAKSLLLLLVCCLLDVSDWEGRQQWD